MSEFVREFFGNNNAIKSRKTVEDILALLFDKVIPNAGTMTEFEYLRMKTFGLILPKFCAII